MSSAFTSPPPRPPRVARLRRLAFASVLLIAAAAVVTFLAWRKPVVVRAHAGQVQFVTLPDGSQAALNSGSVLRYRRNFQRFPFAEATQRTSWLEGEAFFTVQPDEHPFVVATHNAQATTSAASFNVRARRGEDEGVTRVSVTQGRVEVAPLESGTPVEVEANQTTVVEDASLPPAPARPIPAAQDGRWRMGAFVVRELPLAAVLAEVERRFQVRVTWEGDLPSSEIVTLTVEKPSGASDVLRVLAEARSLTFRTTGRRSYAVEPAR